jgi:16S rRNA (adenine1518-N6/adenine1519-N6)-dimethyltransferase
LFKVPRHLFTPVPEVDSAVLLLKKRAEPAVQVKNREFLFKIVRAAFGQRRKTLLNALGSVQPGLHKEVLLQVLDEAGIDGQRRGETLSLEEFAVLANAWEERKSTL